MTIEGVGAGKGDVYRPVKRDKYNEGFDKIKFPKTDESFVKKNGKLRKVYNARSK